LPIVVEEAKNSCTMACCSVWTQATLISRSAAILGASAFGRGEVLEMSADNFRQCLVRARATFTLYEQPVRSGEPEQPLSLPKETRGFIEQWHVDPTIFCSSLSMSSESGISPPKRSAEIEDVALNASMQPFFAITHFSNLRTRSTGSAHARKG